MKAYIEIRSQKAVGTWPKCGPDKYVMVQIVPDNVAKLSVLNHSVAKKRGIKLIYCGEGYSNRTSDRSMYGQAIIKAREIANEINSGVIS